MTNASMPGSNDPNLLVNQMFQAFQTRSADSVDRFWRNQNFVITAMESFSRGWFARRHEGARSAMEAAHAAATCGSASEAVGCWNEWFEGSMKRMLADMEDARAEMGRIAELNWTEAGEAAPDGNGDARAASAKGAHRAKGSVTRLAA